MRIRVLSDLHREFGHVELPEVDADIVVLAGDTDRGVRGVRWAIARFSPTPVLYIAGNHEFYGETFEKVIARKPTYPLEEAIRGMLPKNRLGRKLFKNVKVYAGESHPHGAQKPEPLQIP